MGSNPKQSGCPQELTLPVEEATYIPEKNVVIDRRQQAIVCGLIIIMRANTYWKMYAAPGPVLRNLCTLSYKISTKPWK